jgi:ABC-type sugar transport system permease subunit
MLLYLAGLSNIPSDLYEAADIDGASRCRRFWHVTWPQLALVVLLVFLQKYLVRGIQLGAVKG